MTNILAWYYECLASIDAHCFDSVINLETHSMEQSCERYQYHTFLRVQYHGPKTVGKVKICDVLTKPMYFYLNPPHGMHVYILET